jgi:hypothetical protein
VDDGGRVRVDPGSIGNESVPHEIPAQGVDQVVSFGIGRTLKTGFPTINLEAVPANFGGLPSLELPGPWSDAKHTAPSPGDRDALIGLLK